MFFKHSQYFSTNCLSRCVKRMERSWYCIGLTAMYLQFRCHPDEFMCERNQDCMPRILMSQHRIGVFCPIKKVCNSMSSKCSNYYCRREKFCILITNKYGPLIILLTCLQ